MLLRLSDRICALVLPPPAQHTEALSRLQPWPLESMCGICLVIQSLPQESARPEVSSKLQPCESLSPIVGQQAASLEVEGLLHRRGPDAQCATCFMNAEDMMDDERVQVGVCTASVLSMRGTRVAPQPLFATCGTQDEDKAFGQRSFLCWNGEVFSGLEVPALGNDGEAVLNALLEVPDDDDEALLRVLSSIHGPFAFVYWQVCSRQLTQVSMC